MIRKVSYELSVLGRRHEIKGKFLPTTVTAAVRQSAIRAVKGPARLQVSGRQRSSIGRLWNRLVHSVLVRQQKDVQLPPLDRALKIILAT